MSDEEARIREEAYKIWMAEGQPEGRADFHWAQAKEILALKESFGTTLVPLAQTLDDPVEPTVAFENQAEMPGLDEQSEGAGGPTREAERENADEVPL